MNYLLDTHTLLWSLFKSSELSKNVIQVIKNTKNIINVSVVNFWEISLKYAIGKLQLTNILPDDLPELCEKIGFEILDLKAEESSSFYKLKIIKHKDPFDRMLIWQAIHQHLLFISRDKSLKEYKKIGLKIFW